MQHPRYRASTECLEHRKQLRFESAHVFYSRLPPHETDGYHSISRPFSIGVSFTGHIDATIMSASGRLSQLSLAPGTWGTTGQDPITWLRVTEPSESLMIYPSAEGLTLAPREVQLAWQRNCAHIPESRFDPVIWSLCERFRMTALGARFVSKLEADSMICKLLGHVAVRYLGARPKARVRGKLDPRRLARVTELIESRLHKPPTLGDLAIAAAMSPFHFQRMFCATTGLSPHAYVAARRMERARRMLDDPRTTVAEVTRTLGFAESAHLRRVFRRQFNESPCRHRLLSDACRGHHTAPAKDGQIQGGEVAVLDTPPRDGFAPESCRTAPLELP
jgi:AraC family transcriptional regulator